MELSAKSTLLEDDNIAHCNSSERPPLNMAFQKDVDDLKGHIQPPIQPKEDEIYDKRLHENTDLPHYNLPENDNEMDRKKTSKFVSQYGDYSNSSKESQNISEQVPSIPSVCKINSSSTTTLMTYPTTAAESYNLCTMERSRFSNPDSITNNANVITSLTNNRQRSTDIDNIDVISIKQPTILRDDTNVCLEPTNLQNQRHVIKETVFSSEIHSIEYDSSLIAKSERQKEDESYVNKREELEKIESSVSVVSSNLATSSTNYVHSAIKPDVLRPLSVDPAKTKDIQYKYIEAINSPKREEMVVFDDIGDIDLRYISNVTSSNRVSAAESNLLQQRRQQEPNNNCDVNVTYDLIQGTFPPPSVSGLVVRTPDADLVTNDDTHQTVDVRALKGSIDNLYLGEEASASLPSKNQNTSILNSSPVDDAMPRENKVDVDPATRTDLNQCYPFSVINAGKMGVGIVEIAQYEGSPRRYRPRISAEVTSNASVSSGDDGLLPPTQIIMEHEPSPFLIHSPLKENTTNIDPSNVKKQVQNKSAEEHRYNIVNTEEHKNIAPSNVKKQVQNKSAEEVLRFDNVKLISRADDVGTVSMTGKQKPPSLCGEITVLAKETSSIPPLTKSDFDFRYEFSETRKVLDEFFNKAENEYSPCTNLNFPTVKGNGTELVNIVGSDKEYIKSDNTQHEEGSMNEFNDLNYTLRRFSPNTIVGSTAVGQRLAGTDEEELIKNAVITSSSTNCSSKVNVKYLTTNYVEVSDILQNISNDTPSYSSSNLMGSVEDAALSLNSTINRSGNTKNELCEEYHENSKELIQIPSNTYHTQQQIGNTNLEIATTPSSSTASSIGTHIMSSSIVSPSSSLPVTVGFPSEANPSNISLLTLPTASNNHQITNSLITNAPLSQTSEMNRSNPNIQNAQEVKRDGSQTTEMQHQRDAAFVMSNNPTQSASGSDMKQVEVSNIGCGLIANSTQQQPPPQCATALVGDTRLNVATHYSTALNLDHQQRSSYNTTDVMALSIDDSARDTETNHRYDSKSNIRLDCSSQETMKICSIPNSSLFSSNKDVGTPPSSNISNDPFNVAGFGAEKGIHNVGNVVMVSNNLANSSIIESRNFTLSPETTDCDSADLESEVSLNEGSYHSSGPKFHTAMPILEDGLSSGHASDLEDDVIYSR